MRFSYHFEPTAGWINDPNGLCFYNGQYHAFFQYNPYAPRWDTMHWGHAVSEDLIHWTQMETALYPDQPYEDEGGCFSGSAVEKDGMLYLLYTAVSRKLGEAQALASSRDGIRFDKCADNPLIRQGPYCTAEGRNPDFRDPKVIFAFGKYCMVLGACNGTQGQVLLYTSLDLIRWQYEGILYASDAFGGTPECPDLYPLGDKWVLMFSAIKPTVASTVFVVGEFDGHSFTAEQEFYSELGPDFYAPQSFEAPDGRRILISWFYRWDKELPEGAQTAGALSIPREVTLRDGRIYNYPVAEARHLLTETCPYVQICGTTVTVSGLDGREILKKDLLNINGLTAIEKAEILFDTKAVEIFINDGQLSLSQWLI